MLMGVEIGCDTGSEGQQDKVGWRMEAKPWCPANLPRGRSPVF